MEIPSGRCGSIIYTPDAPPSQVWSSWDVEAQRIKGAICTGGPRRASQRWWHLNYGVQIIGKRQSDLSGKGRSWKMKLALVLASLEYHGQVNGILNEGVSFDAVSVPWGDLFKI